MVERVDIVCVHGDLLDYAEETLDGGVVEAVLPAGLVVVDQMVDDFQEIINELRILGSGFWDFEPLEFDVRAALVVDFVAEAGDGGENGVFAAF